MAESIVRSLVRMLATVGVLAAVYFFIVSPILDTTNETIDRAFDASDDISRSVNDSLRSAGINSVDSPTELGGLSSVDLSAAIDNAPDQRTKRLLRCIESARGNVDRIVSCQRRFQR